MIDEYLKAECTAGRVLSLFKPHDFPQVQISLFGVVPNSRSGNWCLIVDLSSPNGESVNKGILEAWCSLSYVSMQDAAQAIRRFGRGSLMAKVDIKIAYRNVPIHLDDRWLLGMRWRQAIFIDTVLPLGLRSAPKFFTALVDAAEWVGKQQSVEFLIHYLDDFLLVGRPGTTECSACLQCLLQSFDRLGFPIALDKLEGPSTCLTFLVDPVAMTVCLPSLKLMELKQEVDRVITLLPNDRSCTKKDFESLVGRLAHASQVVQPGKTFMRSLSELLASRRHCKPWHLIRLNVEARADLLWWSSFIESWNGISIIPGDGEVFQIWTDASD